MKKQLVLMMVLMSIGGFGQTSITTQIQSSILYTTYNPDTVLSIGNSHDTTSILRFDINNDGINDFELRNYVLFTDSFSWDSSKIIKPLDTLQNTWFISIDTNHYCANTFAVGIDSGKVIEDTLDWSNSVSDIYFNTSPSMMCDMIQPTDFLYYPIKLINNVGDKYFGWIYFSCNDSIILKETAICLIPNQPIYTGHQGLYYGLQEYTTTPSTIILYPNPNDGKFTIHQNNYSPDQQLVIIDLLGNKVYSQALHNSIETIDISQLSGGIYFYEINGKRGKLVKQ